MNNNLIISYEVLKEVAKHLNTNCDTEKKLEMFDTKEIEVQDVRGYIINTVNSNLQYDFNITLEN